MKKALNYLNGVKSMAKEQEYDDIILNCMGAAFKGIEIERNGKIAKVKSVVQRLDIEGDFAKNYGILFELDDNTYLHLLFETRERHADFLRLLAFDDLLLQSEKKKIYSIVIATIDSGRKEYTFDFGSIKYMAEILKVNSDRENVFIGLREKIDNSQQLDNMDKLNLFFYPLMGSPDNIMEGTLDMISLVNKIRDKEQKIIMMGALAGVAENYLNKEQVIMVKEALKVTEIGYLLKKEGVKEGIREAVFTILVNKFNTIPESVYDKINGQSEESVLRGWLLAALNSTSQDDLKIE